MAVFPPLLRAAPFGLFSMLLGLVLGILAPTQQWWRYMAIAVCSCLILRVVIDNTINEFPAFSSSLLLSCSCIGPGFYYCRYCPRLEPLPGTQW